MSQVLLQRFTDLMGKQQLVSRGRRIVTRENRVGGLPSVDVRESVC